MRGLIVLNVPPPGSHGGDAFLAAEPAWLGAGKPRPERAECGRPRGAGAERGQCAAQRVLGARRREVGTRERGPGVAELSPGARCGVLERVGDPERKGRCREDWGGCLLAGEGPRERGAVQGDSGGGLGTDRGSQDGGAVQGTQVGGLGAGGGPRARGLAGVSFGRTTLGPRAARPAVGGQTDDRGAPGGGRRLPPPHRVGGGFASPGSPDVSSSRRSRRERFNWQDFGLRTDVASPGLEAGRAGRGGAGRSGEGSG